MKLIIVDVETTGLDPSQHEIIEIGAVNVDTQETFEVKVHPLRFTDADPVALKLNGFDRKTWMNEAFLLKNGLKMFSEFVGDTGATLMAYNISFDKNFLEAAYRACKLPFPFHYAPLDLMTMAWCKGKSNSVPSLKTACFDYKVPPEPEIHGALNGALTAFEVYKKLI